MEKLITLVSTLMTSSCKWENFTDLHFQNVQQWYIHELHKCSHVELKAKPGDHSLRSWPARKRCCRCPGLRNTRQLFPRSKTETESRRGKEVSRKDKRPHSVHHQQIQCLAETEEPDSEGVLIMAAKEQALTTKQLESIYAQAAKQSSLRQNLLTLRSVHSSCVLWVMHRS